MLPSIQINPYYELINYLLELKWWDWDVEKNEANFEVLSGGDLSSIKKINM